MYDLHRRILSQNFLRSRKLVNKLVGLSSIGENDLVLDIGAGKGIITESLYKVSKNVIALELDNQWVNYLRLKFLNEKSVHIVHANILTYKFPSVPYKVFANVPFSIEGKIIRKLLDNNHPPDDSYLVIRKDLAERLIGQNRECLFSTMYKPWFTFKIIFYFNPFDYEPAARMDTVLLKITKKAVPDIPYIKRDQYTSFVRRGFGNGGKVIQNLKYFYPPDKIKKIFQTYSIGLKSKPSHLKIRQWLQLFLHI